MIDQAKLLRERVKEKNTKPENKRQTRTIAVTSGKRRRRKIKLRAKLCIEPSPTK